MAIIYIHVGKNERNAQSSNYFLQTSFTARRNSSLLSEDLFKVIERLLYTVCSEQCKILQSSHYPLPPFVSKHEYEVLY